MFIIKNYNILFLISRRDSILRVISFKKYDMELIHEIIKESVSGGFWKFCGYWIMITVMLGIPAKVLIVAINRPQRIWSIRKNGRPPTNCDTDGDFKEKE